VEGECATHDDEEDVYLRAWPVALEGVGKGGVFSLIRCAVW
jgi:hypothetical protein